MENYEQIVRNMANTIIETINKSINTKAKYDKTFKCRITGKENDKYQVLYCGNTYTVSSSIACEIGDYVHVCAPCNNWNALFIVCKSKRL